MKISIPVNLNLINVINSNYSILALTCNIRSGSGLCGQDTFSSLQDLSEEFKNDANFLFKNVKSTRSYHDAGRHISFKMIQKNLEILDSLKIDLDFFLD